MSTCLIGLGSNLGDRERMLLEAVKRLREHPSIDAVQRSGWHETRPIGGPVGQGPYLNGAVRLETSLDPDALLATLARTESTLQRQRIERWGARTIDLDLLLYDRLICRTPQLTVPHPSMAWRPFVLRPAVEVAPSMLHPTTGWTVAKLLDNLDSALPYVAVTGPPGVGKTRLAERLVRETSAQLIRVPAHANVADTFRVHRSGNAWDVQLEFLEGRAQLLRPDLPCWSDPKCTWVSDFWFAQSLAYAEVRLSPREFDLFCPLWEEARSRVVEPKLTVLLDLPTDRLVRRIRSRGCPAPDGLISERLEAIRRAFLQFVDAPGHGPVILLADEEEDRIFDEVAAAVEAMNT